MSFYDNKPRYTGREILDICNLFKNIYSDSKGFVKVMTGGKPAGYFYSIDSLTDPEKLSAILNSRRFKLRNMYTSISTFKTMQNARMDNLLNVVALALDVDYKLVEGQENISLDYVLGALEIAINRGFPIPSYIEFSRNIRFVYVLKQPYVIPRDKNKAASCTTFLKRVVKCLADELNSHNDLLTFNATPHKLTSFIRVPYSLNFRRFWHYDYEAEWFVTDRIECEEVNFAYIYMSHGLKLDGTEILTKWDIDELANILLPDLFDGYEKWKSNSNKKSKKSKNHILYSCGFCDKRLRELEELQHRGYDKGYRENLCYLYWITLKQKGLSDADTVTSLKQYNQNFKVPLSEHNLLTNCKPSAYIDNRSGKRCEGWERKFTDKSIREMLGLGNSESDLLRGAGMTKSEQNKRYYMKKIDGKTKASEIEENVLKVKELRESGMKWKDVAATLNISLATAKRYGERSKKAS